VKQEEIESVVLGGLDLGIWSDATDRHEVRVHARIPFHLYEDAIGGSYPLDNIHITGIHYRIGNLVILPLSIPGHDHSQY
jgi:hypothetical protein